jgi:hypothetical protein
VCLLDASPAAPQVLKIRAKFLAIIFVDSEGSQCRRNGLENHCIDIVTTSPPLFGQSLDDDVSDVRSLHFGHRLIFRATFSNFVWQKDTMRSRWSESRSSPSKFTRTQCSVLRTSHVDEFIAVGAGAEMLVRSVAPTYRGVAERFDLLDKAPGRNG